MTSVTTLNPRRTPVAKRDANVAHQVATTATWTPVSLPNGIIYQGPGPEPFTVASNYSILCNITGVYQMVGRLIFAVNPDQRRILCIEVTPTLDPATFATNWRTEVGVHTGSGQWINDALMQFPVTAGQYVRFLAYQNSGGNLNIVNSAAQAVSQLMVVKLDGYHY